MFFYDVRPSQFLGVVEAVNEIERRGRHKLLRLRVAERRTCAWEQRSLGRFECEYTGAFAWGVARYVG